MKTIFDSTYLSVNLGLLLIRLGVGGMFILHGFGKLMAGQQTLSWVGSHTSIFGITCCPLLWGVIASSTELISGILLILGLFTRVAALFVACVMIMATLSLIYGGQSFNEYSHPLTLLFVFIALIVSGPGVYSMDQRIR